MVKCAGDISGAEVFPLSNLAQGGVDVRPEGGLGLLYLPASGNKITEEKLGLIISKTFNQIISLMKLRWIDFGSIHRETNNVATS